VIGKKNAKHYFSINDEAYFALARVNLERLEKGIHQTKNEILSELVLKGVEALKNEK